MKKISQGKLVQFVEFEEFKRHIDELPLEQRTELAQRAIVLVGGSNNDAFVLGDRSGSYYGFGGNADYAQIADLSRGDVIKLGIGETYFARGDAAGFDLFVARGSAFDLVADVRTTFGASLPVGTFNLASGQSLGIFLGA